MKTSTFEATLTVARMAIGASASPTPPDLLGFSPHLNRLVALQGIRQNIHCVGGKCFVDVRGQRSDWADWLEAIERRQQQQLVPAEDCKTLSLDAQHVQDAKSRSENGRSPGP